MKEENKDASLIKDDLVDREIRRIEAEIQRLTPRIQPEDQKRIDDLQRERATFVALRNLRRPELLKPMRLAHLSPAHAAILVLVEKGGDRGEMPYEELVDELMEGGVRITNKGKPWTSEVREASVKKGITHHELIYVDKENGIAKLTPVFYEWQQKEREIMRRAMQDKLARETKRHSLR